MAPLPNKHNKLGDTANLHPKTKNFTQSTINNPQVQHRKSNPKQNSHLNHTGPNPEESNHHRKSKFPSMQINITKRWSISQIITNYRHPHKQPKPKYLHRTILYQPSTHQKINSLTTQTPNTQTLYKTHPPTCAQPIRKKPYTPHPKETLHTHWTPNIPTIH